jgi:putative hydrolase of HD superfamily
VDDPRSADRPVGRRNQTLLDTLLEVQAFDRVPRMGYVLRGVDLPESVAAHSWQVAFLVWTLAPRVRQRLPNFDTLRALELAMVHDLAELRLGDIPRTAAHYLPAGAKKTAETAAFEDLMAPYGDRSSELSAEYAAGSTAEALLVKACDKAQLLLRVYQYERWGEGALGEFWDNPQNFGDHGYPEVRELLEALFERRRRDSERLGGK